MKCDRFRAYRGYVVSAILAGYNYHFQIRSELRGELVAFVFDTDRGTSSVFMSLKAVIEHLMATPEALPAPLVKYASVLCRILYSMKA